jgi:hypothetical protein
LQLGLDALDRPELDLGAPDVAVTAIAGGHESRVVIRQRDTTFRGDSIDRLIKRDPLVKTSIRR